MSIDDLLDAESQTWKPDTEGDTVKGKLIDRGEWTGDYGTSPTLTIQTDAGDIYVVFCSSGVLKSNVERQNPQIGDEVGIRYLGEAEGKSGRTYKNFKFVVVRSAANEIAAAGPAGDTETQAAPPAAATTPDESDDLF